jgi:hypothetical protein
MSLSRQLAPLALGIACASLGACSSEPSFTLEWRIATGLSQLDSAILPQSIAECTALGLGGVRVETTQGGIVMDSREFDCFADGEVAGPRLSAGEYRVEVTGLRRNGTAWECSVGSETIAVDSCDGAAGCTCSNDLDCDEGLNCAYIEGSNNVGSGDGDGDGDTAEAPYIRVCHPCSARHTQTVEVIAEEQVALEATLLSPPQCDDGIDNDLDGLTDLLDPACARDPEAQENADQSDTVVHLTTTFLNDNPNANCDLQASDSFPLDVVAFEAVILKEGETVDSRVLSCERELAVYSLILDQGDYELELTGYDLNPALDPDNATAMTTTKSVNFTVSGDQGGFVGESFDFAGEDFLPPLAGPIAFSSVFEIGGGIDNTGINRGCEPVGNADSSPLTVESLAITVLDANGDPVDPATLGYAVPLLSQSDAETAVIDCPAAGSQSVTTMSLDWGAYQVEVEGRIAQTACFADTLFPLPNAQLSQPISRVLVDGLPPAGCEDCQDASDCPGSFNNCVGGICVGNG